MGFGPIPWLMMGEILPAKIRGSAASVATAFNWTCTFIVTKTFQDMIGEFTKTINLITLIETFLCRLNWNLWSVLVVWQYLYGGDGVCDYVCARNSR